MKTNKKHLSYQKKISKSIPSKKIFKSKLTICKNYCFKNKNKSHKSMFS